MFAIAVWLFLHLAALGLILLAAAGIGHFFLRRFKFDSAIERFVFTVALGLGLSAFFLFLLGLVGLLYTRLILVLTLVGGAISLVQLVRAPAWSGLPDLTRVRGKPQRYAAAGGVLIAAITLWSLLLTSALYPPMLWDATMHHLVLSREYLKAHRIVPMLGIPHPVLPALNHMLFTWSMALKDDVVAQLIEHTFLMLTALGLYAWGKRQKRKMFGIALAAFWLGSPLVLLLGESAYIDIGLTCFVFLGVYALRIFWGRREVRWWYLGMALLGMAAGSKISGLFFVIAGSGVGLAAIVKSYIEERWHVENVTGVKDETVVARTIELKSLAIGWLTAFAILAPWYGFVFYQTGDPIWPTFPALGRGVFGDPRVVATINSWLQNSGEPRTLTNFLMLSIDWIRYPVRFYCENDLTLFPLIAIWPLAWVVALRNRTVRWWALWAFAFTVYWFFFPHQLRYWLPALPLACVALCESIRWLLERFLTLDAPRNAIWAVLAVFAALWGSDYIAREVHFKGRPPTNSVQREALLSVMSGYAAVRYLNAHANENEKVCVIYGNSLNYYMKPQVLALFSMLHSHDLPEYHWPEDQNWTRWLESQGVTWIYVAHGNFPPSMARRPADPAREPFWPDYELVYSDAVSWLFHRNKTGWKNGRTICRKSFVNTVTPTGGGHVTGSKVVNYESKTSGDFEIVVLTVVGGSLTLYSTNDWAGRDRKDFTRVVQRNRSTELIFFLHSKVSPRQIVRSTFAKSILRTSYCDTAKWPWMNVGQ